MCAQLGLDYCLVVPSVVKRLFNTIDAIVGNARLDLHINERNIRVLVGSGVNNGW